MGDDGITDDSVAVEVGSEAITLEDLFESLSGHRQPPAVHR